MSNPVNDLVANFQDLVSQVPDLVQPLILVLAGAVPFIEGEGSAMIGVIGGVNPLIAAAAGIVGNLLSVVLVVLLSSRIRAAAVARRSRRAPAPATSTLVAAGGVAPARTGVIELGAEDALAKPESKGKKKLQRWLVRFGVPGASILAPLALPTHFTAATLVASGIGRGRVIFWQAIAIVLWAVVVTAAATGFLAAVTSV